MGSCDGGVFEQHGGLDRVVEESFPHRDRSRDGAIRHALNCMSGSNSHSHGCGAQWGEPAILESRGADHMGRRGGAGRVEHHISHARKRGPVVSGILALKMIDTDISDIAIGGDMCDDMSVTSDVGVTSDDMSDMSVTSDMGVAGDMSVTTDTSNEPVTPFVGCGSAQVAKTGFDLSRFHGQRAAVVPAA